MVNDLACAVAWPLIVVFPTVLVWLSSMERSCDAGTRFRRFAEAWSMAGTAAAARSVSSFLKSVLRPPSHIFIAAPDWEIVSSQRRRKAWAAWLRMTFACARGSCASEHAPSLFVLRHEPQNVWMLGMEESVLMRYLDREAMPLIFHLMQPLMRLLVLQISQEKTMGEASSMVPFCRPRKPG